MKPITIQFQIRYLQYVNHILRVVTILNGDEHDITLSEAAETLLVVFQDMMMASNNLVQDIEWDTGIDELLSSINEQLRELKIRLTPHTADAACAPAGDGDSQNRGAADV